MADIPEIPMRLTPEEHPRLLIPVLMRQLYDLGLASGPAGAVCIRYDDLTFVSPHAQQKDRIKPDDIFIYDADGSSMVSRPADLHIHPAESFPMFRVPIVKRKANCVMHTNSLWALLVTSLYPGRLEFSMERQEMLRGLVVGASRKLHSFYDKIEVPIIDNSPDNEQLQAAMAVALVGYPYSNAVLVRRNGLYVWGSDWKSTKTMVECYEYLFRLKLEATRLNIRDV